MSEFHIAMLIDRFPAPSESFIVRQALSLPCTILAGTLDEDSRQPFDGPVVHVGNLSRGFRHSRFKRGVYRIAPKLRSWRFEDSVEQRVMRAIQELMPNVVLAQFGPNGIRIARICRELAIPFVIHFHGYDLSSLINFQSYRNEICDAVQSCSAVVVVSDEMRRTAIGMGIDSEKVHLIPYGVPVAEFSSGRHVGEQPCQFIAVGRLVPKKDPLTTLLAFHMCQQRVPNVGLTFIGDGPLMAQAETFVREREVRNVTLKGVQPNAVVCESLQRAGCFLQHSVTAPSGDKEGWPVAIGEAMACGLPIISTKHAGIVDQVVHGENGFLTDEHDVQAMASHMITLAQDADLRQRMGVASRKRIEAVGDFSNSSAKLRDLLQSIAN